MQNVTIDYVFKTSPKILFKRISTASGLSEWFADDVIVNNGVFTFKWKDYEQSAKYVTDRKNLSIRFNWIDDDKNYLEFKIEESNISDEVCLFITDFIEDDETEDDARELWDHLIKNFKRKIGLN